MRRLRAGLAALALLAPLSVLAEGAAGPAAADWGRRAAACVACHSGNGAASSAGYVPRIAGKPEGYLYQQLLNFRDGRRPQAAMARQLKNLDDAYLRGLAAYFARLDLPYPAPALLPTADAVQRGRTLVLNGDPAAGLPACVSCHGAGLAGRGTQVPGLLGLPAGYLSAQLGAWRAGVRRGPAPDCMASIARALPAQDIAAVSRWLASQPVPSAAPADDASPARPPLDCGAMAP